MAVKKYYKIGSPSYGEVVNEDSLHYFLMAKNRNSKTIDVVKRGEAFNNKEDFIKYISDEYNRQIENHKNQIKWMEGRIVYETELVNNM